MASGNPIDADRSQLLQKWETAVDQAIRDAHERGDFDNLPGHGKPLDLTQNPYAGDMVLGFGILKNAGFAPYWIEVDKEIRAEIEALRELRERAGRVAVALLGSGGSRSVTSPLAEPPTRRGRLGWFFRPSPSPAGHRGARLSVTNAAAIRERRRREYLDRAAQLNDKIAHYNTFLPRELLFKERMRPAMEQNARDFDADCPPIQPS